MANIFKYRPEEIFIEDQEHNKIAYITFPKTSEGNYCIDHTFVDESMRGQGLAEELVHRAITYIHNKKAKASATCTYAKSYMEKNGINE